MTNLNILTLAIEPYFETLNGSEPIEMHELEQMDAFEELEEAFNIESSLELDGKINSKLQLTSQGVIFELFTDDENFKPSAAQLENISEDLVMQLRDLGQIRFLVEADKYKRVKTISPDDAGADEIRIDVVLDRITRVA